jgi:ABC-type lipoprotein release transport system permease subunit
MIPFRYTVRSLLVRKTPTAVTMLAIALVVWVLASLGALVSGVREAFVVSGEADNLLVLRASSSSETISGFERDKLQTLKFVEGIAQDAQGEPLVSPEIVIVVNKKRKGLDEERNVVFRGVSPAGFELRRRFRIVKGERFRPGVGEVIVAAPIARRYEGFEVGETFQFQSRPWKVVGHFEAAGSAAESEVWLDANELGDAADRATVFSSALLRVPDAGARQAVAARIGGDPRLNLKAKEEQLYYREQTGQTTMVVMILTAMLAVLMAVGTVFAAANAMYAAVAYRVREVGTMRALGFSRASVLVAFLLEATILSLAGGALGAALSFLVNGLTVGMANFNTFSEVVFKFRVTPALVGVALAYALVIGLIGGLLPAFGAARTPLTVALRET